MHRHVLSNWSRDGERLFTRVELECANGPKRNVSGITLLADGQWVDAQATVIDGNSDVHVRRYRRASNPPATVPAATTAPLSVEDIIEASAKVQSEALEAALDELNPRFALDKRVLTQLADNGVSRNVIDLMVAQAYPDKLRVERDIYASMPSTSGSVCRKCVGWKLLCLYGLVSVPVFQCANPFYSSYYYYSPFAYRSYWGPYLSYHLGSPSYRNYNNYKTTAFRDRATTTAELTVWLIGGDNALPGSPDSRGRRRRRGQRTRIHPCEAGGIGQQQQRRRQRDASQPLARLHTRRAQRRQQKPRQ